MKKICFAIVLWFNSPLFAQQIDVDYTPGVNPEKGVKITLFKSLGGGLNSQGVYEITSEALRVEANNGDGLQAGISVFGNYNIFGGDLENLKTRASHLLYPYGGLFNGQLTLSAPLVDSDTPILLTAHGGIRLNDTYLALPQSKSTQYLGYEAGFGGYKQFKLWENTLQGKTAYSWLQPTLTHYWLRKEDVQLFYDDQLNRNSWSWGLQTGLEWNKNFRLSLFYNQFISKQGLSALNQPILRINFVYRFVKRNRKVEMLELD